MNKHIKLVKKYLADPKSVTEAKLRANSDAANAAYYAADADTAADVAYKASDAAYYSEFDVAAYWVRRYEELTNEK